MSLPNFYCICGKVYEVEVYDDQYLLNCLECGSSDSFKRKIKTIELTINKDAKKMTFDLTNLKLKEENDEEVKDVCSCGDCGKIYRVSDLASETESGGWEMPQTYTVHFCPKCEDGGHIEDYWYDKRPLWLIRSINFIGYNWRNNVWKK